MTEQTEHNHVLKIQTMIDRGELPADPRSVLSVTACHDDACGLFSGGFCNCDPDIRLRWSQSAASRN